MKVWVEFPESTRFAKRDSDILYTPIFFANEGVSAHYRLDDEWEGAYDLSELTASVKLNCQANLGFLSFGGRPFNGLDVRYAVPSIGFRPIYTLEILNLAQRITLGGEHGNKIPFTFHLPTATLNDLQQLASSMKVITADAVSTMSLLRDTSPALIVSVTYILSARMKDSANEMKGESRQEIRVFTSLAADQVPAMTPPFVSRNRLAELCTTQIIPLGKGRTRRRSSIPLIRRKSRATSSAAGLEDSYIIVEVEPLEPFTFRRHDDAAATRARLSLTYHGNVDDGPDARPPGVIADVKWLLKSLSSLSLEPLPEDGEEQVQREDDYFHLRAKILPIRKLRMRWSAWEKLPPLESSTEADQSDSMNAQTSPRPNSNTPLRWKSSQDVWLTQPLNTALTPSFTTPYLTHLYVLCLSMTVSVSDQSSGLKSPFGPNKTSVELTVPVQVRYDLGLVPSYEIDGTLPEYDHTLPRYEDGIEDNEGGDFQIDEADDGVDDVLEALRRSGIGPESSSTTAPIYIAGRVPDGSTRLNDGDNGRPD